MREMEMPDAPESQGLIIFVAFQHVWRFSYDVTGSHCLRPTALLGMVLLLLVVAKAM
jgi:hypothetical protein